jgi:outer membrane phospholipase A
MIILKNNEIELLKYSKTSFDLEIIKIIKFEDIISIQRSQHSLISITLKQQKSQKIKIDLKNEKESKNFITSLTERKNALLKNKNNK